MDSSWLIAQREEPRFPLTSIFLGMVGFVPQLLWLLALDGVARLAFHVLLPLGMGPYALVHAQFLRSYTGMLTPLAWISALFFTLIWQVPLTWIWRESRFAAALVFVLGTFIPAALLWSSLS